MWSGDVVYVDVMMRLWTMEIMLQVVGAPAYCWVCVQMKPLVISQFSWFGSCDQLSWFWPFVAKFKNHRAFSELHIGTHINRQKIVQSCKFPHLVKSSTLHQAGGPSPIKQVGSRPLISKRKSRRAWEMSYVLHRYLDTWSIYDAILEVKISFTMLCV